MHLLLLSIYLSSFVLSYGVPIVSANDLGSEVTSTDFNLDEPGEVVVFNNVEEPSTENNLERPSDSIYIALNKQISTSPNSRSNSWVAQKTQIENCKRRAKGFSDVCAFMEIDWSNPLTQILAGSVINSVLSHIVTAVVQKEKEDEEEQTEEDIEFGKLVEKAGRREEAERKRKLEENSSGGSSTGEGASDDDDTQVDEFIRYMKSLDQDWLHKTVEDALIKVGITTGTAAAATFIINGFEVVGPAFVLI